jgi:hypothetical protein
VYLFWPETACLSLEEIAHNFGDEVAVHIYDTSAEEKKRLDRDLQVSAIDEGVRSDV